MLNGPTCAYGINPSGIQLAQLHHTAHPSERDETSALDNPQMAPFWVKPVPSSHIESLPNSPSADSRSALFGDRVGSVAVVDMSVLDDAALEAEAERGTHLAREALRTAVESREVAGATAEKLKQQTGQLEGIRDTVEDTKRNLDGLEGTVEKLTKSTIRRVAEAPVRKIVGGGRKGKKGGKKDDTEKERMKNVRRRERSVGRIEQLFGKESAVFVGEAAGADAVPEDDYKDFGNVKVREQLKQQDCFLDGTSVQLRELKELALGIQKEIELEAEIIDEIEAPEVTQRIRTNHRKIVRALRV